MTILHARLAAAAAVVAMLAAAALPAFAQSAEGAVAGAPTPDSLAALVMTRFATGSAASFDSVYPDPLGRMAVASAIERHATRTAGITRVLWSNADHAVLLLTATVHDGKGAGLKTGSDETNSVRRLSGLYEARRDGAEWRLTRQIPFDTLNAIRAQVLHVALHPGRGSEFVDTMTVSIGSPYGFAVRLNNATRLDAVDVDGRAAPHTFGGGVLWVGAPRRPTARLVLRYAIDDEHPADSARTAADTAPAFGSLDNSDVWHPFFGYDSDRDLAMLSVTATIPAEYQLTTSVLQSDTVRDGVRIVHGESQHPEFLLALIYDRAWRLRTTRLPGENVRFETFLGPDFRFSHDTLAAIAARVYRVLVPRFGEPQVPSRYLAVVEDRALGHTGFAVRMNNDVVSGDRAELLDEPVLGPSFGYAHEVAHAWTMNATGRAANFLREGWATFCEGALLADVYGPQVERAMWEKLRTAYTTGMDRAGFRGGFEGRQSILANPDNGRIHYYKGSWILHQLEYVLGRPAFDRAMRAFIARAGSGPDGYPELIADMSRAAGHDMTSFIMPWLTSTYIPDVDAHVEGGRLIVTQSQPGPLFDLPLDVDLVANGGTVHRRVHLTTRADTVDVAAVGPIAAVHVDPDHHFLLRRHWGDVVQFTLRAPDAKTVELAGNFVAKPMPAQRDGDRWTVTLHLTEGRYLWLWRVDGKSPSDADAIAAARSNAPDARAGIRIVRPVERLDDADAR